MMTHWLLTLLLTLQAHDLSSTWPPATRNGVRDDKFSVFGEERLMLSQSPTLLSGGDSFGAATVAPAHLTAS